MLEPRSSRTPTSALCGLSLLLASWIIGLNDSPARADSPAAQEGSGPRLTTEPSLSKWPYRISRTAPSHGPDRSWWGLAGTTGALAICGGIYAVCRRFLPSSAAGAVRVVSRTSLSPKHSVYVLRIGRRVLLVGTGPQGAPSLITELDELAEIEPDLRLEGAP